METPRPSAFCRLDLCSLVAARLNWGDIEAVVFCEPHGRAYMASPEATRLPQHHGAGPAQRQRIIVASLSDFRARMEAENRSDHDPSAIVARGGA